MSGALLTVDGLSLAAAGRCLVDGLVLQAHAGERWCVIGRNAAGKSTLLRALAGLGVSSRSGRVTIRDPGPLARRQLAYLAQVPSDRFALSVDEWLELHAAQPDEPASWPLRELDIEHLRERSITELSGGERQRVGLAGVAAQDAALWLLDEPVSFQDPAHQRVVAHWLMRQHERCVILSAHDMGWVQLVATHVIALTGDGQWLAGPVGDVLSEQTLRSTFDCAWRQVEGHWLAA